MSGIEASIIPPELLLPATPRGVEQAGRLGRKSPLEVAREFEAILAAQMIAAMRQTVPSSGLLQASAAHHVLEGAFDQELARSLTKRGDLGIARQLVHELERRNGNVASASATLASASPPFAAPMRSVETGEVNAAGSAGLLLPIAAEGGAPARAIPARTSTVERWAAGRATALGAASARLGDETVGSLVLPVDGKISSGFGFRRDPITGRAKFHGGVDLAAPRGAAVRALASGEVIFSGRRGRAGNVVEVRHAGALVTTYAHVDRTLVHAGQKVAVGDVVATVGSTGRTTGPHLHFEMHHAGQPIDPAGVFAGGRSRGLVAQWLANGRGGA